LNGLGSRGENILIPLPIGTSSRPYLNFFFNCQRLWFVKFQEWSIGIETTAFANSMRAYL